MELWGLSILKVNPNEAQENTRTKPLLKSLFSFTCSEQVVKHPQLCWFDHEYLRTQSRREQSYLIIIIKVEVHQHGFSNRDQLTCPRSEQLVLLCPHERHRAEAAAGARREQWPCAPRPGNPGSAAKERGHPQAWNPVTPTGSTSTTANTTGKQQDTIYPGKKVPFKVVAALNLGQWLVCTWGGGISLKREALS